MFDIHEDGYQHMIIESVTNSSSKTIHVVNFSRSNEIMVGRGSQCEVRITDVSVSRHHSTFEVSHLPDRSKASGWNFVLSVRDEMSKFGTLVFLQKPTPVKKNRKVCLQVGRSIFQFQAYDRLNCLQKLCCLYSNLKKDKSNSIVHYDEAKKYFPKEFNQLFGGQSLHEKTNKK